MGGCPRRGSLARVTEASSGGTQGAVAACGAPLRVPVMVRLDDPADGSGWTGPTLPGPTYILPQGGVPVNDLRHTLVP